MNKSAIAPTTAPQTPTADAGKHSHTHNSDHSVCLIDPTALVTAPPIPQWQQFLFSSAAPTIAAPVTNPFGMAKVQLQVQGGGSMTQVFRKTLSSPDGPLRTLQRGLAPVMFREASKNLFRLGLYPAIISQVHNDGTGCTPPVWKRIVAGAVSGGIGAIACNPFEITRIKTQAQDLGAPSKKGIASGIFRDGGFAGFYRGTGLSVAIGAVITSVNLSTYTIFHETAIHQYKLEDGPIVDMGCALVSGFFSALAANPVDVLRTRVMTQPAGQKDGALRVAARILTTEGPSAFMAGFIPSFCRIGPHFVLSFMLLEQMRRFAKERNAIKAREDYLSSVFQSIDEDSSGEIDRHELNLALTMGETSYDKKETDKLVHEIFRVCDADGDGVITMDEFIHAADSPEVARLLRERHLLAVFRSIDLNGDGMLSESELVQAYRERIREKSSKEIDDITCGSLRNDVRQIMRKLDENNDGSLDFKEFVVAVDLLKECEERHVLESLYGSGVAVG